MGTKDWGKIDRHKGPSSLNLSGSESPGLQVGRRKRGLPLNRLIPLEVMEGPKYYIIEAVMPECAADEISVSMTSRIVTIMGPNVVGEKSGKDIRRSNFSLYLDSPVDPSFSTVYFSRGHLYLRMLKDPGATVHSPVSLPVNG